jgi:hypothetical protein
MARLRMRVIKEKCICGEIIEAVLVWKAEQKKIVGRHCQKCKIFELMDLNLIKKSFEEDKLF